MKKQRVEDYYDNRGRKLEAGLFNVFESEGLCNEPLIYNRRDYYKISLLQGVSKLHWRGQDIDINRPALVFFNPHTPFAWMPLSPEQPGYFCLFRKEFFKDNDRNESLQNSPLFKTGNHPVFFLNDTQLDFLSGIFRKMLEEVRSDYVYKYDLLQNYLQLIIHEALKMKPDTAAVQHKNAAERIASLFLELLERQFPIDSPERSLRLRTASDYAAALSIHVNHLNHAVKEATGQPTSAHIASRVLAEAKALLRHTDWPVSQIASGLGFDSPNYFNNFFKKNTGSTPKHIRSEII